MPRSRPDGNLLHLSLAIVLLATVPLSAEQVHPAEPIKHTDERGHTGAEDPAFARIHFMSVRPGDEPRDFTPAYRASVSVPEARDMAYSTTAGLLLLDAAGEIRRIPIVFPEEPGAPAREWAGETAEALGSEAGVDIGPRGRVEAIATEGNNWLLLMERGRILLRLGRRGEDLGALNLPETGYWRELAADRSGRIWLSDARGDRLAAVSAGGQELLDWDLSRRVAGYRGPLRAWCPDQTGGVWLLEGWPATLRHLNAAGNEVTAPRIIPLGENGPLLHWDTEEGRLLLALLPEGERGRLLIRPGGGLLLLRSELLLWLDPPPRAEGAGER